MSARHSAAFGWHVILKKLVHMKQEFVVFGLDIKTVDILSSCEIE
jgi:hypothetical protein